MVSLTMGLNLISSPLPSLEVWPLSSHGIIGVDHHDQLSSLLLDTNDLQCGGHFGILTRKEPGIRK
jgi:hypothetical protein